MATQTKIGIIGGGPGGYVAAIRAAQLGANVTIIEKDNMGGTCLNVGCIPTKALLHAATLYEEAKDGAHCGVMADVKIDFNKTQEYKAGIVKQLVGGVTGLMGANKIKIVSGEASFTAKDTLEVNGKSGKQSLKFDKIIIATGSIPMMPPIPGIDSKQCIDSTGALALKEVPKSMVVIGGGVIGIEIATLYSTLGTKVFVIEMMKEILPMMDGELTKTIKAELKKKGVEIITEAKVVGIKDNGAESAVQVETASGKKEFSGAKVLVSVGRKIASSALNLDKAGIKLAERGAIAVNDKMETNVNGIYAIGDCNGKIMLAHVASAQGEIAAENAMGHKAEFKAATNPSCVYTNPEFAGVGLTEEQAKAQGIDYVVGRFPLVGNGKALIMNGGTGMIKVIAGKKYKEIIGVHMVGPRATDLIAEAALAIGMEATVDELIDTIHAHPTVAEATREAVLAVDKRAIHMPNK